LKTLYNDSVGEVNIPRQTVHIGDATLEAVVEGNGSLTVVFENGMATPLEEWDAVVPSIAARARVLRYDHRYAPPRGHTPARSLPDILTDLEKLLTALTLTPPYVLVGHSWGGVVARLFTHAHPSDVAGLVFVDATNEALDARSLSILPAMYSSMLLIARARFVRRALIRQLCPPGSPPGYRARIDQRLNDPTLWPVGLRTARSESAAIPAALERLRRESADLPAIPVRVLTAGGVQSKSAQLVHEGWKALVARSATASHTVVSTSSHYMPLDSPSVVADAIVSVLDAIRQKSR
jgi:pimeloyl-ACP methyl ester carboxylesterase